MKKALLLFLIVLATEVSAQETELNETGSSVSLVNKLKIPHPIGYVNDFEDILNSEQKNKLGQTIHEYEKQTTREIVIVTVKTIEPYDDIKDFATDLSNMWGVGKREKDNGLAIIFSKSLKQVRISTGYGTEKILTDDICKKVINEVMIPEFKKGEYYIGIEKDLAELIAKWE